MSGDTRGWIRVYVQRVHRGGGLGERSVRTEADGEDMKETVARLRLEDKGAETGSRVTTTGVNQDREEQAGEEAARQGE